MVSRRTFLAAPLASVLRGAGTAASDPKELAAAIQHAKPGDVLLMRDGVWRDLDLVFSGEGAQERPITLRAQTPGKVVLTGTSSLQIGGRYLVVEGLVFEGGAGPREVIQLRAGVKNHARFCRVTRCAIRNYSPADKNQDSKWLSLYGSDNRVDHCYFSGKTNLGQTMVVWLDPKSPENRHRIDHNHWGPRPPLKMNGGESLRVGDSSTSMLVSRTTVEANLFEACNGEVEVISNKSCENIYRGNRFERCEGTLTLRHGNRCVVEGNVFLGEGKRNTGGIRIIGEDHRVVNNYLADLTGEGARSAISMMDGIVNSPLNGYFQVKRALVAGNTIVNCVHPVEVGVHGKDTSLAPEACVFEKNVIVGTQAPLAKLVNPKSSVTWKDNVFYGAETGIEGLKVAAAKPEIPPPPARIEAGPGF